MKSVRIRSFSGPYFLAFGLSLERYGTSLRIQYECEKIRTKKTANMDTFKAGAAVCVYVQALEIYGEPSRVRIDNGEENTLIGTKMNELGG